MKKYTTKQLLKIATQLPDNAKIPEEYARVFNKYHSENPGGRAWITWFIDYLDGKPSILIPQEQAFPYRLLEDKESV